MAVFKDNVTTTVTLGTTTVVTVKKYGDGTIGFTETTAGKPEVRFPRQDAVDFLNKFVTALATVA